MRHTIGTALLALFFLASFAPAQSPPSSFDLRNVGGESYVTSVKSQQGGTCWTFGAMAAMEGNLLMTGVWASAGESGEPALAEYHLDWWNGFNQHNNDDTSPPTGGGLMVHMGGDYMVTSAYLARLEGAVRDVDGQSYTEAPQRYHPDFHYYYPRDIEWFVAGADLSNIDAIKNHIMSDGVIGTCMCYDGKFISNNIHYQPAYTTEDPNHAIGIVGWDDNKSTQAPQPGAWLCKNSWGKGWGDSGYFWISYYDKHCGQHPEMGAISFQEVEPLAYDYVYFHDYHGRRDVMTDATEAFNAFIVKGVGERLQSVSFFTADDGVSYTVKIYDRFESGQLLDLMAEKSGVIDHEGFHTVDLDTKVMLDTADDFYVYLYLSAGGQPFDRTSEVPVLLGASGRVIVESSAQPGESYYSFNSVWEDLYDFNDTANFCVKALTVIEPALNFDFPSGLPEGILPLGVETPIEVSISTGLENYVPGTGMLNYRFSPGAAYTQVPLTELGGGLFEVVLPATLPGSKPQFYFSGQGDGGTSSTSPKKAPGEVYAFDAVIMELRMDDDFETDLGWEVYNVNLTDGEWERGDPGATDAQPEDDHSPDGTLCYVTGKAGGSVSGDDVDGGPTYLFSPHFDLEGEDGIVRFHCWFHHSTTGEQQPLRVSLVKNSSMVDVMLIQHNPQWKEYSFRVSDYTKPSSLMQVCFEVMDYPNDSVVEALIDDFRVELLNNHPSLWADGYEISASAGAEIRFTLRAGVENGGRKYLLLGTVTGTQPGYAIPGGEILPINWDLFTDLVLTLLNTPVFQNFHGNLQANGDVNAILHAPGGLNPAVVGLTAHFAYLLGPPPGWDFTSTPVPVTFVP